MTERPKWTRAVDRFMDEEVMDDKYEWPPNGEADDLIEEMLAAVRGILCREFGHQIEEDHCGMPEHRYCIWCQLRESTINPKPDD